MYNRIDITGVPKEISENENGSMDLVIAIAETRTQPATTVPVHIPMLHAEYLRERDRLYYALSIKAHFTDDGIVANDVIAYGFSPAVAKEAAREVESE